MKKIIETLKSIPLHGWIIGIALFALQYGAYRFANLLSIWTGTINYSYIPKIPFDNYIPLLPSFVIVYVFSYVFWIGGFIAASKTEKDNYINFLFVIFLSIFIGFLILWLAPTKMDRKAEGLIDAANKNGPFAWILNLVYSADGDEIAINLFPSFHCLLSLCCYLAVFRRKEIHIWFRIYSLVMVVLISMSTVFTKQHYFVDILGGLAIPIIVYAVIYFINPGKKILTKKNK